LKPLTGAWVYPDLGLGADEAVPIKEETIMPYTPIDAIRNVNLQGKMTVQAGDSSLIVSKIRSIVTLDKEFDVELDHAPDGSGVRAICRVRPIPLFSEESPDLLALATLRFVCPLSVMTSFLRKAQPGASLAVLLKADVDSNEYNVLQWRVIEKDDLQSETTRFKQCFELLQKKRQAKKELAYMEQTPTKRQRMMDDTGSASSQKLGLFSPEAAVSPM
jgi:hypothetical protein